MFRKILSNQAGVTLIELIMAVSILAGVGSTIGVKADQMEETLQQMTQKEDVIVDVQMPSEFSVLLKEKLGKTKDLVQVTLSVPGQKNDVVIFVSLHGLDEVTEGKANAVKVYVSQGDNENGVVIFVSLADLKNILPAIRDFTAEGIIDVGDLPDGIIDVGDLPDGIR